jgi:primary-amine oxidase
MSASPLRRRLRAAAATVVLVLTAGAVPVAVNMADAASGNFACSASFLIDRTLANGARWQMCFEIRSLEGIVFHDITYTPPGGGAVEVLGQANLAQIHVPYDDNGARFHDESDFGLGGGFLNDLTAADCPGGTLINVSGKDVLCRQEQPNGYAWKSYSQQVQSTTLSLFSVSHIGAYNYVISYNFDDDGTIRPAVGATGQLQRIGSNPLFGWDLGGGSIGIAHMHNFYWRLDFDVDGEANDQVQELQTSYQPGRERLNNLRNNYTVETARRTGAAAMRTWRIMDTVETNADNHPISFELLPNTDVLFRGPTYEPWTQNEFYATTLRACERFASHNPGGGGCASNGNLSTFVNGESLTGSADLVVWYGTSFHHLPRDEDQPHMHPHVSQFSIIPRDLTAQNPAG